MTRDEVIRLAREAGNEVGTPLPTEWNEPLLERFAALVAAHEREECARFLERGVDMKGLNNNPVLTKYTFELLTTCATAIRARGKP